MDPYGGMTNEDFGAPAPGFEEEERRRRMLAQVGTYGLFPNGQPGSLRSQASADAADDEQRRVRSMIYQWDQMGIPEQRYEGFPATSADHAILNPGFEQGVVTGGPSQQFLDNNRPAVAQGAMDGRRSNLQGAFGLSPIQQQMQSQQPQPPSPGASSTGDSVNEDPLISLEYVLQELERQKKAEEEERRRRQNAKVVGTLDAMMTGMSGQGGQSVPPAFGTLDQMLSTQGPPSLPAPPQQMGGLPPSGPSTPYVPSLRNRQPQPPTPGLRPPNPYEQRYHDLLAQDPQKARAFMNAWAKENIEKQKTSPLAQAMGRSVPLNGSTYGFGGELTPGAEERIARALATVKPGSTPGGLTASQKRQLAVPIQKSGLQAALESFGTKEEKMLRGTRDYQKVGDRLIRPGSRTQAHIGPDGKVTLVGGERASSTDDLGKYISEVSDETTRRMKTVGGVIERKNAMKSKLQKNRDMKIVENKLKKNPLASLSEPKNASEAGIAAVMKGIQQNEAIKFDNKSKEALYQTGVNEFMERQKMASAMTLQGAQNKSFESQRYDEFVDKRSEAYISNGMDSDEAMDRAVADWNRSRPGAAQTPTGPQAGGDILSVTPKDAATAEKKLTTNHPNIIQGIAGKSPKKAQEWLNDQYKGKPPEELKNLVKQYTEGNLTPKQREQASAPTPIESYVDAWKPKDPESGSFLSKYLSTVGSAAPGSYIQRHSGEAVQPPPGFQTKPLGNAHRAITGIPGIGPYLDISPQRLMDQLLGRE